MVARGNLFFEWSQTKSQDDLERDRSQCSNATRGLSLPMEEQEQRFENCLQAHGDLIPSSRATALGQAEIQAYVNRPQASPETTCARGAQGNARLFSQCMEHQRSYSETYCLEDTNKQSALYIQCMAGRGFTVSGLPEANVTQGEVPPAVPHDENPLPSPSQNGELTPSGRFVVRELFKNLRQ
jgi:hypothetical protein